MLNKKIVFGFLLVLAVLFIFQENTLAYGSIYSKSDREKAAEIQSESQERIANQQALATKTAAMYIGGAIIVVGFLVLVAIKSKKPVNEDTFSVSSIDSIGADSFCAQCGKEARLEDSFCSGCGKKLETEKTI